MNPMAYWHYFTTIESDLVSANRYVEIAKHNQHTFSIGFAHIILSAGSEVDVICRLLRGLSHEHTNMDQHRQELRGAYPLHSMTVYVLRSGWELRPWRAWGDDSNPEWWKSYNDVKHHRHEHFRDATLANALDALAGLYCLDLVYYHRLGVLDTSLVPRPQLLTIHVSDMIRANPLAQN